MTGPRAAPLLIGQSLELWRPPLSHALAEGDGAALVAHARLELAAGASALDVNAGAEGSTDALVTAGRALRRALPRVPLFLDSGDAEALAAALPLVPGPLAVNAVALRGGATSEALLAAAGAASASVVLTPRLADYSGEATIEELLIIAAEGRRVAREAGLGAAGGALYFDCLAFPPVHDRALCLRSIALLRALSEEQRGNEPEPRLRPLVAVGNVGHGAPPRVRSALRRLYAALAAGVGAEALIVPAEDARLLAALAVLRGERRPESASEAWLEALSAAAAARTPLPPPPIEVGAALVHAWALLQGR